MPNLPQTRTASVLFRAVLAALSLVLAATSFAAEARKMYDIPAGPALDSFKEFASQSGTQLLYAVEIAEGVNTNAVKGELTTKEALEQLLSKTGLVAVQTKNGAIAVNRASSPNVSRAIAAASDRPNNPRSVTTDESGEKVIKMDTFEVFAGRTLNMDMPRTRDDVQPYVIFDSQTIENSGATNLEDFFKNRLPMNTSQTTARQVGGTVAGTQSTIDLRGLGVAQTLILVDGRRYTGSLDPAGNPAQFNVNGIPVAAVERVEILPSTAGSIYGGGATGGVVNIILKRNYNSFDLALGYGDTFRSDSAQRRFDVTGGMTLEGGRTHIMLSLSYYDSDMLTTGQRDFYRRSLATALSNRPAGYYSGGFPQFTGTTANVANAVTNANLVLKNGTILNSPITYVPLGYAGPSTDNGAALAANQGKFNLEQSKDFTSRGGGSNFYSATQNKSASFSIRRNFMPTLEGFIDFGYEDLKSVAPSGGAATTATIQPTAASNPFTTAILVRIPGPEGVYPRTGRSESIRTVGGVIAKLPHDWKIEGDYTWNRAKTSSVSSADVFGDPDGAGPAKSLATALADGTLDILRDTSKYPLDLTPYALPSPNNYYGPVVTKQWTGTIRAAGPTVDLPGGKLALLMLAEHRRASADDRFGDTISTGNPITGSSFGNPGTSQQANALYLEAGAPLLGDTKQLHFLKKLELRGSVRSEAYSTRAPTPQGFFNLPLYSRTFPSQPTYSTNKVSATSYMVGISATPLDGLTLRSSFATGFLPPSITQITSGFGRNAEGSGSGERDPKRGNLPVTNARDWINGGNPNLVPEESEAYSIGLILSPHWANGVRVSVDYNSIDKTNEIASLLPQQLFDLEDQLPGRIVRAPLTPADAALGYTGGVVTLYNYSSVNFSRTQVRSVDIQFDWNVRTKEWGNLSFYAVATRMKTLKRQVLPTSTIQELVGYSDGPLEWRGNVGATWRGRQWTLGWNAQYFDNYLAYFTTSSASSRATTIANQGSDTIPSQIYHDAFISYRVPANSRYSRILANLEVSLNIQNVFDSSPPILAKAPPSGSTSSYSSYGDPRLARYLLAIKKSF